MSEQPRELYLPEHLARALPAAVRNTLSRMPAERQQEFVEYYQRRAKNLGTAYLLWFLLGWHYAYLGRWGWQILFWLTAGGFFIWWFIDLFRLPKLIAQYNEDVATAIMRDLAIMSQV